MLIIKFLLMAVGLGGLSGAAYLCLSDLARLIREVPGAPPVRWRRSLRLAADNPQRVQRALAQRRGAVRDDREARRDADRHQEPVGVTDQVFTHR